MYIYIYIYIYTHISILRKQSLFNTYLIKNNSMVSFYRFEVRALVESKVTFYCSRQLEKELTKSDGHNENSTIDMRMIKYLFKDKTTFQDNKEKENIE